MTVDEVSIKTVLNNYGDMMYFLALHYVRNSADAEDVVQDVLLSYVQNGGVDEDIAKQWLIKVTVNKCLDFLKKQKRIVTYDDLDETAAVKDKSRDIELFEDVRRLDPIDRKIIFMYYYAGYKTKEIAKILHKTDLSVRKRLERARSQLKKYLEEQ